MDNAGITFCYLALNHVFFNFFKIYISNLHTGFMIRFDCTQIFTSEHISEYERNQSGVHMRADSFGMIQYRQVEGCVLFYYFFNHEK